MLKLIKVEGCEPIYINVATILYVLVINPLKKIIGYKNYGNADVSYESPNYGVPSYHYSQ